MRTLDAQREIGARRHRLIGRGVHAEQAGADLDRVDVARTTEEALAAVYERAYAGATFVRLVGSSLPEIRHVAHTNFCDIGWRIDPSGRAILVSVIDNLLKGASGQAVQNMNVMLGLDETTGLL